MKKFDWDEEKNELLKRDRKVSFEEVVYHINSGDLLAKLDHPNSKKYPHQQIFVVLIEDYVYMVPFVEDERLYFLKTIIPSRKLTQQFIEQRRQDEIV